MLITKRSSYIQLQYSKVSPSKYVSMLSSRLFIFFLRTLFLFFMVVGLSYFSSQFFYTIHEQTANSLSFSSDLVRGMHTLARVERRSRERGARTEGGSPKRTKFRASHVSHLLSRACSFTCLARFALVVARLFRLKDCAIF